MKQWFITIAILLASFSLAVAQTNGTATNAAGTTSTAIQNSTQTTGGSIPITDANSIGTVVDTNAFANNTSQSTATSPQAVLSNSTNQVILANTVAGRLQLLNAVNTGGLLINPVTGEVVNNLANPFNTGIIANPNFNAAVAAMTSGTGNTTLFPSGTFPNGVAVSVSPPTTPTTTTTSSANPEVVNNQLTAGAGSTGTTTSAGIAGISPVITATGVHFHTLTLGSTSPTLTTSVASIPKARRPTTHTIVRGIVQRKDGTFTNVKRQ